MIQVSFSQLLWKGWLKFSICFSFAHFIRWISVSTTDSNKPESWFCLFLVTVVVYHFLFEMRYREASRDSKLPSIILKHILYPVIAFQPDLFIRNTFTWKWSMLVPVVKGYWLALYSNLLESYIVSFGEMHKIDFFS